MTAALIAAAIPLGVLAACAVLILVLPVKPGRAGLNDRAPMPDGAQYPAGNPCGCELAWRPCVIHDPAWPAEMERMVRGDSEPA